ANTTAASTSPAGVLPSRATTSAGTSIMRSTVSTLGRFAGNTQEKLMWLGLSARQAERGWYTRCTLDAPAARPEGAGAERSSSITRKGTGVMKTRTLGPGGPEVSAIGLG